MPLSFNWSTLSATSPFPGESSGGVSAVDRSKVESLPASPNQQQKETFTSPKPVETVETSTKIEADKPNPSQTEMQPEWTATSNEVDVKSTLPATSNGVDAAPATPNEGVQRRAQSNSPMVTRSAKRKQQSKDDAIMNGSGGAPKSGKDEVIDLAESSSDPLSPVTTGSGNKRKARVSKRVKV